MGGHSNWLGRIEYPYYDLGRTNDLTVVSNATALTFREGRQTTDVLRAGLSYQLN